MFAVDIRNQGSQRFFDEKSINQKLIIRGEWRSGGKAYCSGPVLFMSEKKIVQ